MPLGNYIQRSTETKLYSVDYTQWLQAGETLTTQTVSVIDNTPTPLIAIGALDSPNNKVNISVSGGQDNEQYAVSVLIQTSLNQVKDDCIFYTIQDTC